MILNIKKLVFSIDSDDDVTMVIDVKGPAVVTGADIQVPSEVKMISNDLVIAHVAEGAHLYMEMYAHKDRGYASGDQNKKLINTIGIIPTDSIYSPVVKVSYAVEPTRVGQRYKGLGEMNAEQLAETTMNPGSRTLIQVKIEDGYLAEKRVSVLMGDNVEPRKEWIEENVEFSLEDDYKI